MKNPRPVFALRFRRRTLVCVAAVALLGALAVNIAREERERTQRDALFAAISARNVAAVERSLAHGANANAARKHHRYELSAYDLGRLVHHLLDPNEGHGPIVETPLGVAVTLSREDRAKGKEDASTTAIVRALLRRGADPNVPVEHAFSHSSRLAGPLARAIEQENGTLASLLLDAGAQANPDAAYVGAETPPLFAAINVRRAEMVSALLARRAKPNRKDRWGENAVHYALASDRGHNIRPDVNGQDIKLVRLLLASGASPTTPDRHGRTPLAIVKFEITQARTPAVKAAYQHIASLLRQAGATR